MNKIVPKIKTGVEYAQISLLPFQQFIAFRKWLNEVDIFIIQDEFGMDHECVAYEIYDFWFDAVRSEREEYGFAIF